MIVLGFVVFVVTRCQSSTKCRREPLLQRIRGSPLSGAHLNPLKEKRLQLCAKMSIGSWGVKVLCHFFELYHSGARMVFRPKM